MESEPLTIDQINILASIETRDVLLAKIAGGFNAPLTKMAVGLKALLNKSGYAFKALLDVKEANPETSSEAIESDSSSEDSEDKIKEEE
jgi:ribosomal protein L10